MEPRKQKCISFSGEKPSFREWMLEKHGYTPEMFRILCLKTGKLKDYYKGMDWYRIRYEKEMSLREVYVNNNPFSE